MTTTVHVVNFGPQVVEVERPGNTPQKIYQRLSADFQVYDGMDVTIKEVKQTKQDEEKKR